MSGLSSINRSKNQQPLTMIFKTLAMVVTLALVGCSMPPKNSSENFCMKVDPSSPDYNPGSLSTEELKICRDRAEKILQVQTMQVQIHRQRDEVIALNSSDLIIENKALIENALSKLPESSTPQQANLGRNNNPQRNVSVTKQAQSTSLTSKPQSVQQHFLSQSAQREFDRQQAQKIATKVETLINSEEKQAFLNTPRSLQPGEEVRGNRVQTTLLNNQVNVEQSEPILLPKAPPANNTIEGTKTNTNDVKTITTTNSVTTTSVRKDESKDATQSKDNLSSTNKNGLSIDYTSLPNFASEVDAKSTDENKNKLQGDSVEKNIVPEPIIDGKTRPDPLIRLQQIRNQN